MAQRPTPAPANAPPPESGAAHLPATTLPPRPLTRGIVVASYLLVAAALWLVMWRGLLPGLLCVCLGFVLTRALTRWSARGVARLRGQAEASPRVLRAAQIAAAGLVMLAPLALLAAGLTHSRGYLVDAPQQYRELLNYMARTVLEHETTPLEWRAGSRAALENALLAKDSGRVKLLLEKHAKPPTPER